MQFTTLAAAALFSSIALAAPTTDNGVVERQTYPSIPVTFNGAAGTGYQIVVLGDNVPVTIDNDLSITSISMEGRASFTCTAYGVDGSKTFLVASQVSNHLLSIFNASRMRRLT